MTNGLPETPDSLTGGCMCGAVRYRISEKPIAAALCHCNRCRPQAKLHGGVLRATPNASNDDRQYHGDLSEDHACDIRSGRSAKVEKHLSAPLGVKNRFAQ
jgi:hypothetical protein